jgi:DNA-binding FrmR family transcriptional regulator
MDYDPTGAYIGGRLIDAPEACRHANDVLSQLHAVSMPLEKFMKDIYPNLSSK